MVGMRGCIYICGEFRETGLALDEVMNRHKNHRRGEEGF